MMTISERQTGVRGHGLLYTDWRLPTIERLNRDETLGAVMDLHWQEVRLSMKGKSTFDKMETLQDYWRVYRREHEAGEINDRELHLAKVRVINYLTALKRGGQLSRAGRIQK